MVDRHPDDPERDLPIGVPGHRNLVRMITLVQTAAAEVRFHAAENL